MQARAQWRARAGMDLRRGVTVVNVIVGAWRLLAFEIKTSTGDVTAPFGDRPQGSIIYTESGRYAAQVMRPGRASFVSGNQLSGTPF